MIFEESKLKKYLDDPVQKAADEYYRQLLDKDEIISIGSVDIDAVNIVKRRFSCDPLKCRNLKKCRKKDDSCCSDHGVMASESEKRAMIKLISDYRDDVKEVMSPKFSVKKIFTPDDDYEGVDYTINKNTLGSCGLSFHDAEGRIRCVIEHICRKNGLYALDYKPMWCYMWPMSFIRHSKDRFLLTVYCMETRKIFRLAKSEVNFSCMTSQDDNDPPFYRDSKEVIEHIFGSQFYEKLAEAAENHMELVRAG